MTAMQLPLDAWQERLQRHFADLAALRTESNLPVFALEHGLAPEEVTYISGLLRSRLRNDLPSEPFWLLWVIYATEYGYRFDGQKFWNEFQHDTPNWDWQGDGNKQLKAWFARFQKQYKGVAPSGPWARHFSIICWPVTHAVLPKYLQYQFAQTLWENRYQLARLRDIDANSVGDLLTRQAWNATSRFSKFLEQQELAGRIALAVLSRNSSQDSPIYEPTLTRIVGDLEKVRRAGLWLKETRSVVRDKFEGIHKAPIRGLMVERNPPLDRNLPPVGVQHKFLLRRNGPQKWSCLIRLPDFSPLAELNPKLSAFLNTTRCKVTDGANTWMPAGWLLSGSQTRAISKWPVDGNPILSFERHDGILENIVDQECRPAKGPTWLFRVGPDGLAREIGSKIVHPSVTYVLMNTQDHANSVSSSIMKECDLKCDGIVAREFTVPEYPSPELVNELQASSLQIARTLRVWPAGLCAHNWDGDGYTEWLTGDAPCFAVISDHPVETYQIQYDAEREVSVKAGPVGKPTFIQLSAAVPGLHRLKVKALRNSASKIQGGPTLLDGEVTLKVRDPKPWVAGTTAHTGLVVYLDPPVPMLDDLSAGELSVSVQGPRGCAISCGVTLFGSEGTEIGSYELCKADLPMSAEAWIHKTADFFKKEPFATKALEADFARLTIDAEEMGLFVQRVEREHKPLNWSCGMTSKGFAVRLRNDSSSERDAKASFSSFEKPCELVEISKDNAMKGLVPSGFGGLYFAKDDQVSDAVIVSSSITGSGFQGLLPQITQSVTAVSLVDLAGCLNCWASAKVIGPLGKIRKDNVVSFLRKEIVAAICGRGWAEGEQTFRSNDRTDESLRTLRDRVGGTYTSFIVVLDNQSQNLGSGPSTSLKWFAEIASRYKISDNTALCEAALVLASDPPAFIERYRDSLDNILVQLRENSGLVRSARYLLLKLSSGANAAGRDNDWKWS